MIKKFRDKLKEKGQTLKWFHGTFLNHTDRKYSSMAQQVGEFVPITDEVKDAIQRYMSEA